MLSLILVEKLGFYISILYVQVKILKHQSARAITIKLNWLLALLESLSCTLSLENGII